MGSSALRISLVASALMLAPAAASAQFAGPYGPGSATITASHGGSVDTSGAPSSITLYGGNDNSGLESDATYSFTIPQTENVSFNWNFTQVDCCGAVWDPFGYLVNGVFNQLTSDVGADSQSGSVTVALNAGDVFGFDQRSLDSISGQANTVVSDFSTGAGAVPEPATWAMMLLGFGGIGMAMRRRKFTLLQLA